MRRLSTRFWQVLLLSSMPFLFLTATSALADDWHLKQKPLYYDPFYFDRAPVSYWAYHYSLHYYNTTCASCAYYEIPENKIYDIWNSTGHTELVKTKKLIEPHNIDHFKNPFRDLDFSAPNIALSTSLALPFNLLNNPGTIIATIVVEGLNAYANIKLAKRHRMAAALQYLIAKGGEFRNYATITPAGQNYYYLTQFLIYNVKVGEEEKNFLIHTLKAPLNYYGVLTEKEEEAGSIEPPKGPSNIRVQ